MHACVFVPVCVCVYVCGMAEIYVCACMCVANACVCVCMHVFVWVYTCMYMLRVLFVKINILHGYWAILYCPSHTSTPVFLIALILIMHVSSQKFLVGQIKIIFGLICIPKEIVLTWISFSSYLSDRKYLSKPLQLQYIQIIYWAVSETRFLFFSRE